MGYKNILNEALIHFLNKWTENVSGEINELRPKGKQINGITYQYSKS